MQTTALFHLWPKLHEDLLRFLDLAPDATLTASSAEAMDLGHTLRHVAAVEDYWRRVVLERSAEYREIVAADCSDREALRQRLSATFAATRDLLQGSRSDALLARPVASVVTSRFPVHNALEALTLCHMHTVHHRAAAAARLLALGIDPGDWL